MGQGDYVVALALGENQTCVLTSTGDVYTCGESKGGNLGLSDDVMAETEEDMIYTLERVEFKEKPELDDWRISKLRCAALAPARARDAHLPLTSSPPTTALTRAPGMYAGAPAGMPWRCRISATCTALGS